MALERSELDESIRLELGMLHTSGDFDFFIDASHEDGLLGGAPPPPPHPPYIYAALSYVWGATADSYFQAKKSTIEALEAKGYLFENPLPATIEDAICACRDLQIRYLWVDRLCIVQDDEGLKNAQINAMGDIYRHSYVTLVDIEGLDMNHGLPGVMQDRDCGQKTYRTRDMCMKIEQAPYSYLVHMSK
ncbi:HET domain-containing protein [Aspergillus ibericus CBS 121593]|uniref:HET-domain-containing protein n=1 Tax=Aspergillus ibericus CBS 121593 TaxID=1448316 RepID=A0A395GYU8_9EURO|nr:HET-domain-containing protein [Aspergillus ibericus CBS 121593]RAL00736.1 HET-domain-containing protein [Aspergillus ibericus CBS 121593]